MAFRPAGVMAGFLDLENGGFTRSERRVVRKVWSSLWEDSSILTRGARSVLASEAAGAEDHATWGSVKDAMQVTRAVGGGSAERDGATASRW